MTRHPDISGSIFPDPRPAIEFFQKALSSFRGRMENFFVTLSNL